ncbi:hypothetical protein HZC32_00275 [Candidatus Woesearchaeota archaeon]|nr:hypothetical protein [Candidatus Woesearchaeota archaeon]
MKICIPKETYPLEKRVMLIPNSVKNLVKAGHEVFVQSNAAVGVNIEDEDYSSAGAKIVTEARDLYNLAELVVKVKAPSPEEFSLMHDITLLSMFHSEQNPVHIYYAGKQNLIVVEVESIRDEKNKRFIDQTDITGKAGVYYALQHSKKTPEEMKAVILGYGHVSSGAIEACARLGIEFKIIRKGEFKYIPKYLKEADLLINGIAWPESRRSKKEYLVTREDIKNAQKEMIVLDLSVDFPNPIETVRPTTYSQPYYLEEGRVHISLYGYPGLVPITSTNRYSKQIEPIVLLIADNGDVEGISKKGDLGIAISKAIIYPHKLDWTEYKPTETPPGSRIE